MEETPERVMQRFMSFLLYDLTKGEVRISPRDLRSSVNSKPLPEEVLDLLRSEEFTQILEYFEDNIIFSQLESTSFVEIMQKSMVHPITMKSR